MIIDSAHLFPLVVVLSVFVGFFSFIAVGEFFVFLFIIFPFAVVLRNLRDDGRYAKWGPILMIGDIVGLFRVNYAITLPAVIWAALVLLILMIIVLIVTRQEVYHFDRTILSMNKIDRGLARTALKSGKFEDFTKVAKYTDWDTVS